MFSKKIDLTPPSSRQVLEFRHLAGLASLMEDIPSDAEEIDISGEQLDPDEQIDPDDASKRDPAEDNIRKVTGYDGKVKWDGKKPGPKVKAKKK